MDDERELESATGANVQVDQTDSSQTFTFDDGKGRTTIASGKKLAVPANYPPSGFIPEDAVIKSSASQDQGMIIVYSVPGSLPETFDRNRKALHERGWTEEDVVPLEGGSGYVSYRKGDATLSEDFVTGANDRIQATQTFDSGG